MVGDTNITYAQPYQSSAENIHCYTQLNELKNIKPLRDRLLFSFSSYATGLSIISINQ